MSYDQYRDIVKSMSNRDLNNEIVKIRGRRGKCMQGTRAYEAWTRMLETAEAVARSRDGVDMPQVSR